MDSHRALALLDMVVVAVILTVWFVQESGRIPSELPQSLLTPLPIVLIGASVLLSRQSAVGLALLQAPLVGTLLLNTTFPGAVPAMAGLSYAALRTAAAQSRTRWSRTRVVPVAAVALVAGSAGVLGTRLDDPLFAAVFPMCVIVAAAGGALWRLHNERRPLLERQHKLQHELLQAEREYRVVAEKSDLAREVHDVMAHSLAVVLVQADGARAVVRHDADRAASALDDIARTTRASLTELRLLLESAGTDGLSETHPTIGDLEELAERFRGVGMTVHVDVDGVGDTPTYTHLTMYRIVQESLTNALRYSGPPPNASVRVTNGQGRMLIHIASEGINSLAPADGSGRGIPGMQERASQAGGSLVTEFTISGFSVRAVLPVAQELVGTSK